MHRCCSVTKEQVRLETKVEGNYDCYDYYYYMSIIIKNNLMTVTTMKSLYGHLMQCITAVSIKIGLKIHHSNCIMQRSTFTNSDRKAEREMHDTYKQLCQISL